MQISNLNGFSGCKVLLCEDEHENTFVRKISPSINYNDRLSIQMKKQMEFNSLTLSVPKVYNSGYENGLFYFDMEYLQGITLLEKLKTIRVCDIRKYVDIIGNFLFEKDGLSSSYDAKNAFKIKIEQLAKDLLT